MGKCSFKDGFRMTNSFKWKLKPKQGTVESRLYVQVGTQKFGRRTERDVQVKIIFRITPCKVFWTRLDRLDVQTSGTYNWDTYNWDSSVISFNNSKTCRTKSFDGKKSWNNSGGGQCLHCFFPPYETFLQCLSSVKSIQEVCLKISLK